MSRLQSVKAVIYQRLSAAVEEIIGHLETTIRECEEEMRSRHRQLLQSPPPAALSTDLPQQLLLIKQEQQEWTYSPEQEQPHIKEENEDEQLQGLQDKRFPLPHVTVKNEDDEEKHLSSQLQQSRREKGENRKAEHGATSSRQMEANGEDGGPQEERRSFICLSGSDDNSSHFSEALNEDSSDDWRKARKVKLGLNTMKTIVPLTDRGDKKLLSCSRCGRRFAQKHHLKTHMRCHTGEKPFVCSVCGKRFTQKGNLTQHLTVHTRDKLCTCPVCGERFAQKGNLTQHMTVHTREKLCS